MPRPARQAVPRHRPPATPPPPARPAPLEVGLGVIAVDPRRQRRVAGDARGDGRLLDFAATPRAHALCAVLLLPVDDLPHDADARHGHRVLGEAHASAPLTGRLSTPTFSTGSGHWLAETAMGARRWPRHPARAAAWSARPRRCASASVSGASAAWAPGAETASAMTKGDPRVASPGAKRRDDLRVRWMRGAAARAASPVLRERSDQIWKRQKRMDTGGAVLIASGALRTGASASSAVAAAGSTGTSNGSPPMSATGGSALWRPGQRRLAVQLAQCAVRGRRGQHRCDLVSAASLVHRWLRGRAGARGRQRTRERRAEARTSSRPRACTQATKRWRRRSMGAESWRHPTVRHPRPGVIGVKCNARRGNGSPAEQLAQGRPARRRVGRRRRPRLRPASRARAPPFGEGTRPRAAVLRPGEQRLPTADSPPVLTAAPMLAIAFSRSDRVDVHLRRRERPADADQVREPGDIDRDALAHLGWKRRSSVSFRNRGVPLALTPTLSVSAAMPRSTRATPSCSGRRATKQRRSVDGSRSRNGFTADASLTSADAGSDRALTSVACPSSPATDPSRSPPRVGSYPRSRGRRRRRSCRPARHAAG